MHHPVVYAPSVPSRYDPLSETRIPVIDLKPAYEYGEVKLLTSFETNVIPETIPALAQEVHDRCAREMRPEDYVLMVGDPALIAGAIAGATTRNGAVNTLRWDRHKKAYDAMRIEL